MAEVEDPTALLVMALRDLYDGENALAGWLPSVRDNIADRALAAIVEEDHARSERQRSELGAILGALGEMPGGPPNIWLRAILDDARNDIAKVAPGPLLDIALTGALRKGKQSERVSYETAIGLAALLGHAHAERTLRAIRDEEAAADAALADVLERLCERKPTSLN
jgi:ferritin-like metal-binding protein YciE